jgi:hypothetical protein
VRFALKCPKKSLFYVQNEVAAEELCAKIDQHRLVVGTAEKPVASIPCPEDQLGQGVDAEVNSTPWALTFVVARRARVRSLYPGIR